MRKLTVIYERDEAGWWVAAVREVAGCHTQGRSIEEAKRRIREALSLFMKNPNAPMIVDEIRLPLRVREPVAQYRLARRRAETEKGKAARAAKRAASALTRDLNLGVRDAGRILDLSHQCSKFSVTRRSATPTHRRGREESRRNKSS